MALVTAMLIMMGGVVAAHSVYPPDGEWNTFHAVNGQYGLFCAAGKAVTLTGYQATGAVTTKALYTPSGLCPSNLNVAPYNLFVAGSLWTTSGSLCDYDDGWNTTTTYQIKKDLGPNAGCYFTPGGGYFVDSYHKAYLYGVDDDLYRTTGVHPG